MLREPAASRAATGEVLLSLRKDLRAAVEAAAPERLPAETQFTEADWNRLLSWLSGSANFVNGHMWP